MKLAPAAGWRGRGAPTLGIVALCGALCTAALSPFAATLLSAQTGTSAQAGTEAAVVAIEIATSLGLIRAEIYPEAAPITAENFLTYVDEALFDGGSFFRTVRPDNQPTDSVRIDVIQGGPDRSVSQGRLRGPIPLERTRDTGLRHVDGALSMARGGPDTARSQFFICLGDQPMLDFGGNRNLDGQGFAVFGRVTEGMDIVRHIQSGEAEGQRLIDPVVIESVRRSTRERRAGRERRTESIRGAERR